MTESPSQALNATDPLKVVVLVSGTGSLLQNIIDNQDGSYTVIKVVADVECKGIERARNAGIATEVVPLGADRAQGRYFVSGELGYYQAVGPMLLMSAGLAVVWVAGINMAVAAGFAINARRNAEPSAAVAVDASAEAAEAEESAEGADNADMEDAQDGAEASEEQADNNAVLDAETDEADGTQEDSDTAAAAADANDDYIDGEVEESEGSGDSEDADLDAVEPTDSQETELSDSLMDNLEDGAFPDSVPGEDDVEERFDAAEDAEAPEATTSPEVEDSIEGLPSETEGVEGEVFESEVIEHKDDESVADADADAEAEDSEEQSKKNDSN